MNISIQRAVSVFLLMFLALFGCAGSEKAANHKKYPDGDIEEFIWDTRGGGDQKFSIERVDDNFKIVVERYDFNPADMVIILTEHDSDVYAVVKKIFSQDIDIYDYTFTPQGVTGSWTKITLIFSGNRKIEIENIQAWKDDLGVLSTFVHDNAAAALQRG